MAPWPPLFLCLCISIATCIRAYRGGTRHPKISLFHCFHLGAAVGWWSCCIGHILCSVGCSSGTAAPCDSMGACALFMWYGVKFVFLLSLQILFALSFSRLKEPTQS